MNESCPMDKKILVFAYIYQKTRNFAKVSRLFAKFPCLFAKVTCLCTKVMRLFAKVSRYFAKVKRYFVNCNYIDIHGKLATESNNDTVPFCFKKLLRTFAWRHMKLLPDPYIVVVFYNVNLCLLLFVVVARLLVFGGGGYRVDTIFLFIIIYFVFI